MKLHDLTTWFLRYRENAVMIDLMYQGAASSDEVASWAFPAPAAFDEVAQQVRESANEYADAEGARCEFRVRILDEEKQPIATKRVRGYPSSKAEGGPATNADQLLKALFKHVEKCHVLITESGNQVHEVYGSLLDKNNETIRKQQEEIRSLHTLLRAEAEGQEAGDAMEEQEQQEGMAKLAGTVLTLIDNLESPKAAGGGEA